MYVTEIRPESNTVVLGDESELERQSMQVSRINLIKYDFIPPNMVASVKIRYKSSPFPAHLKQYYTDVEVDFLQAVKGIAPGQSAVFYEGDDVIAGGII